MDSNIKAENIIHDIKKIVKNRVEVLRDKLIQDILDADEDLAISCLQDLRRETEKLKNLEEFPSLNVVVGDMPDGVAMMAFGSGGIVAVLHNNGMVTSHVIDLNKKGDNAQRI